MPGKFNTIQEAIAAFDRERARERIREAEKQREKILERFPLDEWPSMTLEEYAIGQPGQRDTFGYWMEWGSATFASMKGGSARKHIIFRRSRGGGWFFDDKTFSTVEEAWEAVRAGFVEAFRKAQEGDWDTIDDIPAISSGSALRAKALHVYFPDEIIPVASREHIRHYLAVLGRPEAEERGWGVVRRNRALLRAMREIPELQGWTTTEMARLLYSFADPRETMKVVKIAPGERARLWPECLSNGYICVGWDKIGDLRQFDSKESFLTGFSETFGEMYKHHVPTIKKKSKEVWTLVELEPGDVVVANNGTSKIVAVGEVVEPGYEYRAERSEYKHVVHVKWDTSYAQDIEPQKKWAFATVAKMPATLYAKIMAGGEGNGPMTVDPVFAEIAGALDRKGQAILYGPPGTGKTYTARRFGVWWLLRQLKEEKPEKVLTDSRAFEHAERRLSTVQVSKRVWWIVANPGNWGWDQLFADGRVDYRRGRLQRNYPLVQEGDLVVGYESTPSKRIKALARVSKGLHASPSGQPKIELEPLAKTDGLSYDELLIDPVLAASEPLRFRCQGTLFALSRDEAEHLLSVLTERQPDLSRFTEAEDTVGSLTRLTFHASYSYEDFVEGFRPVDTGKGGLTLRLEDGVFKRVCREAQANPGKPYLVLVDEINRSNIAKVLGELITLLEKDKRGLVLTLPQSKEPFTIPPNVYLLGTMNTADRSIKQLDAALRRRFAFLEMMPDLELLSAARVGNLALDEFLEELNRRVARREGREKQIGHSYLLDGEEPIGDPEEFARRFRQEILPLLQEYCYDEYASLAEYIGEKLVDKEAQTLDQEKLADPDQLLGALEEEFKQAGSET